MSEYHNKNSTITWVKSYRQGAYISGRGSAVPRNVVSNHDLSLKSPIDSEWTDNILEIKSPLPSDLVKKYIRISDELCSPNFAK